MITNNNFIEVSVDTLKRKLVAQYVYLASSILLGYASVFYFLIKYKFFAACTFAFVVIIFYTFIIIRKNYNVKTFVHLYLIYASLFAIFVMLGFWKYSAVTCMWLLPIPLAARILLEKKYIYIYSAYILLIIISVSILTKFHDFNYFSLRNIKNIVILDTFVGIVNSMVCGLLLYYNEKIRKVEIEKNVSNKIKFSENTEQKQINVNSTIIREYSEFEKNDNVSSENLEKYSTLFNLVKDAVEENALFKETDFSISQLSNVLKINNLYIAKSIKANGYSNFNHYLNTCRIQNVKKLIQENDINKITLMYIYTTAGFSNQSTFNRAFKKIEGITPSEYIMTIKEENNNVDHI